MMGLRLVLWLMVAQLAMTFPADASHLPIEVSFATADGGEVYADLYGQGVHGVVLAHGAAFDKESWRPLAERLSAHGEQVLAIDFRGYGKSRAGSKPDGLDEDVLAAVRYLPSAEVSLFTLIETVLGPFWAWVGVGEEPSINAMIGGAIVVGTLALHSGVRLYRFRRRTAAP